MVSNKTLKTITKYLSAHSKCSRKKLSTVLSGQETNSVECLHNSHNHWLSYSKKATSSNLNLSKTWLRWRKVWKCWRRDLLRGWIVSSTQEWNLRNSLTTILDSSYTCTRLIQWRRKEISSGLCRRDLQHRLSLTKPTLFIKDLLLRWLASVPQSSISRSHMTSLDLMIWEKK